MGDCSLKKENGRGLALIRERASERARKQADLCVDNTRIDSPGSSSSALGSKNVEEIACGRREATKKRRNEYTAIREGASSFYFFRRRHLLLCSQKLNWIISVVQKDKVVAFLIQDSKAFKNR